LGTPIKSLSTAHTNDAKKAKIHFFQNSIPVAKGKFIRFECLHSVLKYNTSVEYCVV